tara:strand:+ start:3139 stop:5370 length:2232 start_codon:yes stop_codon:yes gene_type:complete
MYKILVITFFLFYALSSVKAEVVKSFTVEGNKRISSETIKIYGDIEINKNYNENDLNKILNNLYSTEFFENVKVSIINNELQIKVTEYPFVNQLIIIGEKSNKWKKQIESVIKTKEKNSFIKSNLAKDIENLKYLYSTAGFNSAEIEIKTKEISSEAIDVLIEIDRGKKTKISSINFIGNKKISNRKLRDITASEEHKFWRVLTKNTNFSNSILDLDTRLITNFYKSSGFYDAKVTSKLAKIEDTGYVNLTYIIDEGQRYRIKKISTNVDKVFDKNLFFSLNKDYEKYIGEYYSPFKIKKLLDNIDEIIDKNNLQFVEHNVQEEISDGNINVIFNIFEGEKKLVERINILGNYVTNEDVIRGELIIDEGDPYSKLNLDKSISKIKARNIFKSVKFDVSEGTNDDLKKIDIAVEERATGEISAGAGIGTTGGSFAVGIKENNWLGSGKAISFDLEVDSESFTGSLNYIDPNYDFLGNSLNYSISSQTNDKPDQGYENSITSAGIGTSFEQYKDIFLRIGLNASHDDLRTTSSASTSLQKQKGTYNDISTNYGISFDSRDRVFNPTSGSVFTFGQSIPIYADKSYISNTLTTSRYKALNEDVIGVGKFFISAINGLGDDDVRLSKRQNLSSKRLRGFKRSKIGPVDNKDYIGGNYAAALNLETNLPNILPDSTNADVGFFLDFGNVWGVDYDSSLDDSNKLRSSTGFIANWMSPIGPMNFVLAQNLSKADTDQTQRFTFNLGTTF